MGKCFSPIVVDEQDGENTITSPSFELELARGQEYNTQWVFNVLKIRKGHNYTFHVALSAVAYKYVFSLNVSLLKFEGPGSVWILVSQGLCCCLLPCQLLPVATSSQLPKVVVQCGNSDQGTKLKLVWQKS